MINLSKKVRTKFAKEFDLIKYRSKDTLDLVLVIEGGRIILLHGAVCLNLYTMNTDIRINKS